MDYKRPEEKHMVLTLMERKMFFDNWLKLLAFVNKEYKIIKNFGNPTNPVGINVNDLMKIRKQLWKNEKIIDEYLKTTELSSKDYALVISWKKFIKGKFIVLKELKKYCVFLEREYEKLYGVHGISCEISEVLNPLPIMIETVLIPFNGKIIYDSLTETNNVHFGPNMRKSFNEKYIEIKKEIGIIGMLE